MTAPIIITFAMGGSDINYGEVSNRHEGTYQSNDRRTTGYVVQTPSFTYPPDKYSPVRLLIRRYVEIFGGGFGGRGESIDGQKTESPAGCGYRLCAHAAAGQESQSPLR